MKARSYLRDRLKGWRRSPLFWILLGAAILRLVGITWGLPASDGWDNDGIAPRDFLAGVVQTYQPGSYFTYPPLHLIFLTILTWPGWVLALFKAHTLAQHDVIAEFIKVPYMTFFAVVARVVSAAMSLGTIVYVGKMAELVGGRRAGLFAAATCALNATLTYYGHVTNLDGPYLFWSSLSLWWWMRLIAEREPGHTRWAVLFAVAAATTKDQAYAVFLFSVPVAYLLWFAVDRWPRQHAGKVIATLLIWTAVGTLALLAIDGAITNPAGFAKRIAFLTGTASQDNTGYQNSWNGRLALLKSMWMNFPQFYPAAAAIFGALGLVMQGTRWRENRPLWVAGLLPLLAIISFTLAFNFVALRTDQRFLLPQSVFIAVYIGIAIDSLAFAARPAVRYATRAALLPIAAWALYQCAAVDAALVQDPRYDAEDWLRAHLRPGDTIETYGQNVYLPRFPDGATITRVDRTPITARNPLPDVTEVSQPFEAIAARHPHFIVVSGFWVERYLLQNTPQPDKGRIYSKVQQSIFEDVAGRRFFRDLHKGRLPYRLVHESVYDSAFWPAVHIHQSLAEPIRIFERIPAASK